MNKNNEIKNKQLGMPYGTANNILRKSILFNLLSKLNENVCFQCGKEIESVDHLSVEHKVPWLHSENPTELFFSLDNIAFSHISCNIAASRYGGKPTEHGKIRMYDVGCRCEECKKAKVRSRIPK